MVITRVKVMLGYYYFPFSTCTSEILKVLLFKNIITIPIKNTVNSDESSKIKTFCNHFTQFKLEVCNTKFDLSILCE